MTLSHGSIPDEIVQKAWEAGANSRYEPGCVGSLSFLAMRRALEAVQDDLQRSLLEENARLANVIAEQRARLGAPR